MGVDGRKSRREMKCGIRKRDWEGKRDKESKRKGKDKGRRM